MNHDHEQTISDNISICQFPTSLHYINTTSMNTEGGTEDYTEEEYRHESVDHFHM